MEITVGTFNLNNLFGRWNLYAEAPATRGLAPGESSPPPPAVDPPRGWLEEPPAAAAPATRGRVPDVRIVIEGEVTATEIKWRINPYDGRVVYKKTPEARKTLAGRIKAMDVDVLAVQEVENVEVLEEFVREEDLRAAGYKHVVLVEGNDERLIDVGVVSKLPIGAVTSWRHRTYKDRPGERPVFSRDLLQIDVLSEDRRRLLFTLYNNHLKSKLSKNEAEKREGNRKRRHQADTIAAILSERPPPGPFVIVGDMNDRPTSSQLRPLRDLGLVNALADPDESGGPYPADPDPPRTKAWTHRYRAEGRTDYELFDQIWLSAELAPKQTGAWIHRRTSRGGDATDHDPPYVQLSL
jgi:endonuclease/exonuclease/phosphatase family metal-dependent hydrolase